MQSLEGRIKQLEASQRPLDAAYLNRGVVYVLRAAEGVSLHKVGRTKDLAARLRSHNAARADRLEVLHVYKTDAADRVELCVKAALKGQQYSKYKEVYRADLDVIKHAIHACGELCRRVQRSCSARRAGITAQAGGDGSYAAPTYLLALTK